MTEISSQYVRGLILYAYPALPFNVLLLLEVFMHKLIH